MTLASCKQDVSRQVVLAESPDGRSFYFMPIYEDGVTDITIAMAWPMQWAFQEGRNSAVPYIAAEAILSGGTVNLAPKEMMELFSDKNTSGGIYVRADHAIGELSFPIDYIDEVVPIAQEMLVTPQFSEAWTNRIKQGFLANQSQAQSQSANQMWMAARLAVLGDSPVYDFISLPNLDDIRVVDERDLRQWHEETIVQSGVTISVTGAISSKEAGRVVDQLLSGLPEGVTHNSPTIDTDFTPRRILLHLPDAEKSTLGIIGSLPATREGGDLVDLLALNFFARSGDGPLFEAIRTDLRASYGLQAGYTNYDRATRIMFIGGEVETAKLAEATEIVLDTYEDYRLAPDLTDLDDIRRGIADSMTRNIGFVDVAARSILELALDDLDVSRVPSLGADVEGVMAVEVAERLSTTFPSRNELMIFAASPDAGALPGACVVTELEQILQCP